MPRSMLSRLQAKGLVHTSPGRKPWVGLHFEFIAGLRPASLAR